jgi:hypothetical protein
MQVEEASRSGKIVFEMENVNYQVDGKVLVKERADAPFVAGTTRFNPLADPHLFLRQLAVEFSILQLFEVMGSAKMQVEEASRSGKIVFEMENVNYQVDGKVLLPAWYRRGYARYRPATGRASASAAWFYRSRSGQDAGRGGFSLRQNRL